MSWKRNYLDHSLMENFFDILKQEMYDGEPLMIYDQLEKDKQLYEPI